ncbi:unnamed protein product [Ceutorhynchus assimilis]|uniref:Uncharacterized protein n=1 Tax=Ceutorhynchus assimilis TaxID=467358 RepID=A0A9N9QM35_9CUCU|nr:unnamed protein product [Ceutorhynchus assimilis]
MASNILPSRIIRHQLQTSLQHPIKLRNLRNFCDCNKPDQSSEDSSCERCISTANDCENAENHRQPEAFPCKPDCRKGKPNILPRSCLPWEQGTEICQEVKKLQSLTCEHICEAFAGQEIIKHLELNVCEKRRFKKCTEKTNDGSQCMDFKPKMGLSKKIYPMVHAGSKNNIAGSPVKEHSGFIIPKKENCED